MNVGARVLLEAIAELDVVIANVGTSYAYRGRSVYSGPEIRELR